MLAKPTAAQRRHAALRTALDTQLAALEEPPYTGPDRPAAVLTECAAAVLRAREQGGTPERSAVRAVVRGSLIELAERVPGHSVEVRVPPFGAVQVVEGPRHTRGTPPGVVQTDPLTWIALAAGRESWEHAVADGIVSATGERTDLSPHLPLWEGL
ncbi:sterol carrier family protein [Allosalinactinospora lopnorensis]|uniref:sterol carrier family protein n=1 Tax=Allosalinactinospora lopnorensis TaxID=1352348 RepID=UPI000623E26B|nr:sterol carrier family protein [Allosalinactinospora lopnorensis]